MLPIIVVVLGVGLGLAWLAGQGVTTWLDWVIGLVVVGWLVLITTVPWNVYFRAREVLAEIALSQERGLAVPPERIRYSQLVARRSFILALALHLGSVLALWGVAQVTVVGYWGAGAALLLTGFRPTVRMYQFLLRQLGQIEQEVRYPREDVVALREQVQDLAHQIQNLGQKLDEGDPTAWISTQQRLWESVRQETQRLASQQALAQAENQAEHQRLARETQQAIAQLSEDSRVLNHVRELIRFFKEG